MTNDALIQLGGDADEEIVSAEVGGAVDGGVGRPMPFAVAGMAQR